MEEKSENKSEESISNYIKKAKDVVDNAQALLDGLDTLATKGETVIKKHKGNIIELFGDFVNPSLPSNSNNIKEIDELFFDVFKTETEITIVASTFSEQPEVELNPDNKSIKINYVINNNLKSRTIELPYVVDDKKTEHEFKNTGVLNLKLFKLKELEM